MRRVRVTSACATARWSVERTERTEMNTWNEPPFFSLPFAVPAELNVPTGSYTGQLLLVYAPMVVGAVVVGVLAGEGMFFVFATVMAVVCATSILRWRSVSEQSPLVVAPYGLSFVGLRRGNLRSERIEINWYEVGSFEVATSLREEMRSTSGFRTGLLGKARLIVHTAPVDRPILQMPNLADLALPCSIEQFVASLEFYRAVQSGTIKGEAVMGNPPPSSPSS